MMDDDDFIQELLEEERPAREREWWDNYERWDAEVDEAEEDLEDE